MNYPDNTPEDTKNYLNGIYNLFVTTFPGEIVSFYLTGSRAANLEIESSDYDLAFVVKDPVEPEKHITADKMYEYQRVANNLKYVTRFPTDITILGEQNIKYGGVLTEIYQRFLITGPDVIEGCNLIEGTKLNLILAKNIINLMKLIRGSNKLAYPCEVPEQLAAYFGYKNNGRTVPGGWYVDSFNNLTTLVGSIAYYRLSVFGRTTTSNKQATYETYRKVLHTDPWCDLVEGIYKTCRLKCNNSLPKDYKTQAAITELCKRVHQFENDFLWMLITRSDDWIDPNNKDQDVKEIIKYILETVDPLDAPFDMQWKALREKYL